MIISRKNLKCKRKTRELVHSSPFRRWLRRSLFDISDLKPHTTPPTGRSRLSISLLVQSRGDVDTRFLCNACFFQCKSPDSCIGICWIQNRKFTECSATVRQKYRIWSTHPKGENKFIYRFLIRFVFSLHAIFNKYSNLRNHLSNLLKALYLFTASFVLNFQILSLSVSRR